MSDPTLHQQFQPIPRLDAPFVDSAGRITIPWYRLLIRLLVASGANSTPYSETAFLRSSGGVLTAYGVDSSGTMSSVGDVVVDGGQIALEALQVAAPETPVAARDLFALLATPLQEPAVRTLAWSPPLAPPPETPSIGVTLPLPAPPEPPPDDVGLALMISSMTETMF